MAWWNFNERKLLTINGDYFVNNENEKLVFFHFSGFKPNSESFTGRNKKDNKYNFNKIPELINLFNDYQDSLCRNGFENLSSCTPKLDFGYATQKKSMTIKDKVRKAIKKYIK